LTINRAFDFVAHCVPHPIIESAFR
jgi:hypothetical protein